MCFARHEIARNQGFCHRRRQPLSLELHFYFRHHFDTVQLLTNGTNMSRTCGIESPASCSSEPTVMTSSVRGRTPDRSVGLDDARRRPIALADRQGDLLYLRSRRTDRIVFRRRRSRTVGRDRCEASDRASTINSSLQMIKAAAGRRADATIASFGMAWKFWAPVLKRNATVSIAKQGVAKCYFEPAGHGV